MFNLGLSEIVLISIIALIFIGPKQLPEIARALGRALNELKRASEDLTSTITNPRTYTPPEAPPKFNPPAAPTPHQTEGASGAGPSTLGEAKRTTTSDEGSST